MTEASKESRSIRVKEQRTADATEKIKQKNKVQSIKINLDFARPSGKNSISGEWLRKNRDFCFWEMCVSIEDVTSWCSPNLFINSDYSLFATQQIWLEFRRHECPLRFTCSSEARQVKGTRADLICRDKQHPDWCRLICCEISSSTGGLQLLHHAASASRHHFCQMLPRSGAIAPHAR